MEKTKSTKDAAAVTSQSSSKSSRTTTTTTSEQPKKSVKASEKGGDVQSSSVKTGAKMPIEPAVSEKGKSQSPRKTKSTKEGGVSDVGPASSEAPPVVNKIGVVAGPSNKFTPAAPPAASTGVSPRGNMQQQQHQQGGSSSIKGPGATATVRSNAAQVLAPYTATYGISSSSPKGSAANGGGGGVSSKLGGGSSGMSSKKEKKSEKLVSSISPKLMEKLSELAKETVTTSIERAINNASKSP